jgi:phosphoinositide-3-kinase regulatory subunit
MDSLEYYFGKVANDEIEDIFCNERDGSFLVRDSNNNYGEFVLVLKFDRKIHSIKICHNGNFFGFTRDCEFSSIHEMIVYYQGETLKHYNKKLDTKLLYPLSKIYQSTESVESDEEFYSDEIYSVRGEVEDGIEKLVKLTQLQTKLLKEQDLLKDEMDKIQAKLLKLNEMKEGFIKMKEWFDEQIATANGNRKRLTPQEQPHFIQNMALLREHQSKVQKGSKKLESDLEALKNRLKNLEDKDVELQHKRNYLQRKEGEMTEDLKKYEEVTDSLIKQIKMKGKSAWTKKDRFKPHQEKANWFFPDYDRFNSERVLKQCNSGTFLIRRSAKGEFALSINHDNIVFHCIINETKTGFGFEEPYNIYESLTDLVLHYARNSLGEHNVKLDVCLKYPYRYYLNFKDDIEEVTIHRLTKYSQKILTLQFNFSLMKNVIVNGTTMTMNGKCN